MRGLCDQGKTRYVRGEPPLIHHHRPNDPGRETG